MLVKIVAGAGFGTVQDIHTEYAQAMISRGQAIAWPSYMEPKVERAVSVPVVVTKQPNFTEFFVPAVETKIFYQPGPIRRFIVRRLLMLVRMLVGPAYGTVQDLHDYVAKELIACGRAEEHIAPVIKVSRVKRIETMMAGAVENTSRFFNRLPGRILHRVKMINGGE